MIIATVLGKVDHGGQHGNAARTRIQDETFDTGYLTIRARLIAVN